MHVGNMWWNPRLPGAPAIGSTAAGHSSRDGSLLLDRRLGFLIRIGAAEPTLQVLGRQSVGGDGSERRLGLQAVTAGLVWGLALTSMANTEVAVPC